MDRETMRKRGWSMNSDETSISGTLSVKEEGEEDEDGLDEAKKKELLNSFPVDADQDDDEEDRTSRPPAHKRRKLGDDAVDSLTHRPEPATETVHNNKEVTLELAKKKLSKWAARLFDPDRPKGLVEPPQTIPLNDEFLTAFGKREKEYDDALGRTIEIDQAIQEEASDDENVDEQQDETDPSLDKKSNSVEGRKVKVTNLGYATSLPTLEAACQRFGPLEHVNLLMDKDNANLNSGRAYVTFETTQSADACVAGLQTLEGRALRVSIAAADVRRSRKSAGMMARYWEKDISTKCFRCGQVGHMESDCPNAAKPKPCPLCAGIDHDMRTCPNSRICFRCGVPGHINRECAYRQNLPKRVVCGICFQSGHHRCSCRRKAYDAPSHDAKCIVCHEVGHFMCSEMKWFFGLEGVTCFNCGRKGHCGYNCDRPGVDMCARDEGLANQEIARAEAMSLADELDEIREGRGRSRNTNRDFNGDRARAQSQPPRMNRPSNNIGPRDGSRGYSSQNDPHHVNRGYDTGRHDSGGGNNTNRR